MSCHHLTIDHGSLLTTFHSDRPTSSPPRVFTVPDDCSTDENEAMDDEPFPGSGKGHNVIDLEEDQPGSSNRPTIIDLEEVSSRPLPSLRFPPQYDGVIDLTPSDEESALSLDEGSDEEDMQELNMGFGVRSGHTTVNTSEDDERGSSFGGSSGSEDLSDTPHLAEDGYDINSPSPTWNSVSSSSESDHADVDMDGDVFRSEYEEEHLHQDFEGHECFDSDSEYRESVLFEEESDEDAMDGMVFGSVHGPGSIALGVPHDLHTQSHSPAPQTCSLPPFLSGFPMQPDVSPTVPCSWTWNSPLDQQKLPSLSDAVLPHGRLDTEGAKQSRESREKVMPGADKTDVKPVAVAQILGQKTGKADYFEAREHNKMTIARITEPSPLSSVSASGLFRPLGGPVIDLDSNAQADRQGSVFDQARSCPTNGFSHGLAPPPSYQDCQANAITLAPQVSHSFDPFGTYNLPSAWEPGSAYDLQQQKKQDQAIKEAIFQEQSIDKAAQFERNRDPEQTERPILQQVEVQDKQSEAESTKPSETHVRAATLEDPIIEDSIAEGSGLESQHVVDPSTQLDEGSAPPPVISKAAIIDKLVLEQQEDDLEVQARTKIHGKRKADLMSEATTKEVEWTIGRSPHCNSNFGLYQSATVLPSPTLLSTCAEASLSSPCTMPEEITHSEARPAKRMKKIAERVGYAALGGATVGAMVLTSLIYSAPTFV